MPQPSTFLPLGSTSAIPATATAVATTMRLPDGSLYEGAVEYVAVEPSRQQQQQQQQPNTIVPVPSGHGVCYFPSGAVYVGEFRDGRCHGTGSLLTASGDFHHGRFAGGECDGPGVLFTRGRQFQGSWAGGQPTHVCSAADTAESVESATLHTQTFSALFRAVHFHFLRQQPFGDMSNGVVTATNTTAAMMAHQRGAGGGAVLSAPPSSIMFNTAAAAGPTTSANIRGQLLLPSSPPPPPSHVVIDSHNTFQNGGGNSNSGGSGTSSSTFALAGPSFVERFNAQRFAVYFAVLLFPVFAIPHLRFCPFHRLALQQERERVLSGAGLRLPARPPRTSVYVVLVGMAALLIAIVLNSRAQQLHVADIAAPIVAWAMLAAMQAFYHGYTRLVHPMERADRSIVAPLAAFAASAVDSYTPVCVYTWDEDGRARVVNRHFRYRWLGFAVLLGGGISVASPIARVANGNTFLAGGGVNPTAEAVAAGFCAMLALFCFSATVTYYVFKNTDMQRQVLGQLRVLTSLAYIGGTSVLRPTTVRKNPFHFDAPVTAAGHDFSLAAHTTSAASPSSSGVARPAGFAGWYITRTFVLYCGVCANHRSRCALMSVFAFVLLVVAGATIVDFSYSQRAAQCGFVAWQAIGGAVVLLWGPLSLRFLYIGLSTTREHKRHEYLIDLAAVVQRAAINDDQSNGLAYNAYQDRDPTPMTGKGYAIFGRQHQQQERAAAAIEGCRLMIGRYDARPTVFLARMRPWMGLFVLLVLGVACAGYAFMLIRTIAC